MTRVANTALAAQAGDAGVRHLGIGSTLGELLRHPASVPGYPKSEIMAESSTQAPGA